MNMESSSGERLSKEKRIRQGQGRNTCPQVTLSGTPARRAGSGVGTNIESKKKQGTIVSVKGGKSTVNM